MIDWIQTVDTVIRLASYILIAATLLVAAAWLFNFLATVQYIRWLEERFSVATTSDELKSIWEATVRLNPLTIGQTIRIARLRSDIHDYSCTLGDTTWNKY